MKPSRSAIDMECSGMRKAKNAILRENPLPKPLYGGAFALEPLAFDDDLLLLVEGGLMHRPSKREVSVGGFVRQCRVDEPQLARPLEQRVVALVLAQRSVARALRKHE